MYEHHLVPLKLPNPIVTTTIAYIRSIITIIITIIISISLEQQRYAPSRVVYKSPSYYLFKD
uniref:Uncharacterized protein n=1 Tax=Glossina brevipalpis TaxID=37001 RepID=A0A1A9X1M8_9MUSC